MRPLLFGLMLSATQLTQAADIGAYSYPFKAAPNLTVNGKSGQVWLYPNQPFSVKVSLDAGAQAGQNADWWVMGQVGNDFYTYDPIAKTWQAGKQPKLQMGLGTFKDYPLFENMSLPSGNFALHFGVETPVDGQWTNGNRISSTQLTIPPVARTFVVSPQGNDANAGTVDQPWKTLKKAAATAQAGDLVLIRGGTYAEQLVPANNCAPATLDQNAAGKSPTETLPLIFAAYPNEKPLIDGTNVSLTTLPIKNAPFNGLIHLNGCHDIWIVGLNLQKSANIGIMAYNSNRIKIIDNSTYNTKSSGIAVWKSTDILVDGNEINLANNGSDQENISIGRNVEKFEVRYNHIHDAGNGNGSSGGEGIDIKDGSSNGTVHHNHIHNISSVCLYLDAWDQTSQNIEFHSNIIHDCAPYNGISLSAEQGGIIKNIKVYNNLIYHVKQIGINIGAGYNHPAQDIYIYNNTMYENGYTTTGFGASIGIYNTQAKNVVIRNNLGASTDAQIINVAKLTTALQVDHNLFIRKQGTYNNEVNGTDYIIADPLFENAATGDFRLKAGSPAIGKGTAATLPSVDFTGQPN